MEQRVRIKDEKLLSDNWYILKRLTFDRDLNGFLLPSTLDDCSPLDT